MVYPDLPNNRLIVGGIDLTERFKMVLVDGYSLEPPSPKIYTVDIPGGNGVIDLTEAFMGDTVYNNRTQTFTFYVIDVQDFEKLKTEISNILHGKDFDYTMTMDPDYTYHGRFTVSSYEHGAYPIGVVGVIEITIDAKPYKYKKQQVYKVDAVGGKIVNLESGRLRVRPTIESNVYFKVIFDNKEYKLPQGTWNVNDILFKDGINEIYFCSFDIRNLTWGDLSLRSFKTNKTYAVGEYVSRLENSVRKVYKCISDVIPPFSTISTYDVGDYVIYTNKIYRCNTAITTAGDWDASKWDAVTGTVDWDSSKWTQSVFSTSSIYSVGAYVNRTVDGTTKTFKCISEVTTAGAWNDSNWREILYTTWGGFKQNKLFEWYMSNGDGTFVIKKWSDLASSTWSSMSSQTWAQQTWLPGIVAEKDPIYLAYDWGDL